jgi:hypothetical protein
VRPPPPFFRPNHRPSLTSRRYASLLSTPGATGGHTSPRRSAHDPVVHPTVPAVVRHPTAALSSAPPRDHHPAPHRPGAPGDLPRPGQRGRPHGRRRSGPRGKGVPELSEVRDPGPRFTAPASSVSSATAPDPRSPSTDSAWSTTVPTRSSKSSRDPTWPAAPPCVSPPANFWTGWPRSSLHPASTVTATTASSPPTLRVLQPSPLRRRVGPRNRTFEACSGFTLVTARRSAGPPFEDGCPGGLTTPVAQEPPTRSYGGEPSIPPAGFPPASVLS